jgi:pimeloyl-ACP methyl ester carboxylesterase
VAPGETLAVVITGSGAPAVLLPGMLGSAFGFRKVAGPLTAAGMSAIVIEPLGFGESGRPKDADYSLPAQMVRVNAVLDSLNVTHATIIAHNMGIPIALRLAAGHPDRVAALVLLDGGVVERPVTPGVKNALRLAPIVEFFGATFIARRKVASALRSHSADPAWVTDSVIAAYSMPITSDMSGVLNALKRMSEADPGDSLAPQLPGITAPVVLLIGRANRKGGIEPGEVALLAGALPSFRVDSVDRSGEYLHEERPDAVTAAALGLLDLSRADSPAIFAAACRQ